MVGLESLLSVTQSEVKMAHYSQIDETGLVSNVLFVDNSVLMENGSESEIKGVLFCQNLTGHQGWKKTSYNGSSRRRYAGIGYTYDLNLDVFIAPKPFPSWSLDSNTNWQPPVAMPGDGKKYNWDEAGQQWQEIVLVTA